MITLKINYIVKGRASGGGGVSGGGVVGREWWRGEWVVKGGVNGGEGVVERGVNGGEGVVEGGVSGGRRSEWWRERVVEGREW